MYTQYFGIKDAPFSIAPNPQFLYMSPRHQEALAHLLYGVKSDGGFILLTGEVGTGKTTLCRCLLEQIPQDVETAFVLNPRVTAKQLLASICDEFGITYPQSASLKRLVDNLNAYLLDIHAQHKRAVLIIDEAQNLSRDLLEQLRLLTNLETSERKLLQIILLGQPELLDMLAEDNLRQFSQRITARFHLEALGKQETKAYIQHRLQVAGGQADLFSTTAMHQVFRLSKGIPRVINLICDRALLGAYSQDLRMVNPQIVKQAALEVLGKPRQSERFRLLGGLGIATAVLVVSGGWLAIERLRDPAPPPSTSVQVISSESEPERQAQTQTQTIQTEVPGHDNLQDAYHDLFALWGSAFEQRNEDPCQLAATVALQCQAFSADLDELAKINRPAIVMINGQFLTLSQIAPQQVSLIAGAAQTEISKSEFRELHDGYVWLLVNEFDGASFPTLQMDQG